MLLLGDNEFNGAQGCEYGEGEEECELVVGPSSEESGMRDSERLRLRFAIAAGWDGKNGGSGGGRLKEERATDGNAEAIRGFCVACIW